MLDVYLRITLWQAETPALLDAGHEMLDAR